MSARERESGRPSFAGSLPGISFRAMNTEIWAAGEDGAGQHYWRMTVVRWYQSVERAASRFLPDNELSRLNAAPVGKPVKLTALLYGMIRSAWSWKEATDGRFQPFIGSSLQRLGYDRSFELIGKGVTEELQLEAILPPDGLADRPELELDDERRTVARNVSATLDLGGMGKGWSTDRAASLLQSGFHLRRGVVDAGGDLIVWSDGEPWQVGVQSPFDEREEWFQLKLKNAAAATSSTMHRRWTNGGKARHHILDGRTGMPVESDIVQATVLGHSVEEAEVAAKVICMLGTERLSGWMSDRFPHLGYMAVTRSGEVKVNRRVYDYAERVIAR